MILENQLKSYLQGEWSIQRRIGDHRSGLQHRFDGVGVFSAIGLDSLAFVENGLLISADQTFEAEQKQFWTFEKTPSVSVAFGDGRHFHDLEVPHVPSTIPVVVQHFCEPDQYEGTYLFAAQDHWSVVWRVNGPRKDYLSHSDFYRKRL